MKNKSEHKMYFKKIILGIIFILIFYGCEKIQNSYIGFSSREQRLIYKNWLLNGASKDGVGIPYSQLCAFNTAERDYDLDFTTPGTVGLKCPLLFPNFGGPQGTWQLKNRNIEIAITDSSYYDYMNYQYVYVPVTPIRINWEIIYLSKNILKVKETRTDGIYEFSFINNF